MRSLKIGLDERVYEELLDCFFNGSFVEGERLEPAEISEKYGVSKTPVTQALKKMGSEGLISCSAGGKYYIPNCTEQVVHDVCDARLLFEKEAAARIIQSGDTKVIQELDDIAMECLNYMSEEKYIDSIKSDLKWHKQLVASCKNEIFDQMYMIAKNKLLALNYVTTYKITFQNDAAKEHLEIMKAIKKKDFETVIDLLEKHIGFIRIRLLEHASANKKDLKFHAGR